MQYNEKVLNEFFNPQNVGVIKGASGKGKIVSPTDREIMKIYITVEDEVITNAMFQTFGCVAAIACTSVATRLMIGKSVEEVLNITAEDILSELGDLPENKMHCVYLAEETVKDAIASYESKKKGIKRAVEDDD
ncbi:MAG: iron-sulfur cluster assembly scaffold protein [Clostridia bacterium]|nr:iron-sulfur cluster assembly scaffold protein [Clostridia bacterium]